MKSLHSFPHIYICFSERISANCVLTRGYITCISISSCRWYRTKKEVFSVQIC